MTNTETQTDREIHIQEIYNTHGCAWRYADDATIDYVNVYDKPVLKWNHNLYELVSFGDGYCVQNLLQLGIGTVIKTEAGAYGGVKRTISVRESELTAINERLHKAGSASRTVQIWDDENDRVVTDLDFV